MKKTAVLSVVGSFLVAGAVMGGVAFADTTATSASATLSDQTSATAVNSALKSQIQKDLTALKPLREKNKQLNQQLKTAVQHLKQSGAKLKDNPVLQAERKQLTSLRQQVKADLHQLRSDKAAKRSGQVEGDLNKLRAHLQSFIAAKQKLLHDLQAASTSTGASTM